MEELLVDGQLLKIYDKYLARDSGLLDNEELKAIKNIVVSHLELVNECDEISFAMGEVNKKMFPYFIVLLENELFRVSIEEVSCKSCQMELIIGNPFVADCYIGANMVEVINKAKPYLKVCPYCNEDLGRPAIWIKGR